MYWVCTMINARVSAWPPPPSSSSGTIKRRELPRVRVVRRAVFFFLKYQLGCEAVDDD